MYFIERKCRESAVCHLRHPYLAGSLKPSDALFTEEGPHLMVDLLFLGLHAFASVILLWFSEHGCHVFTEHTTLKAESMENDSNHKINCSECVQCTRARGLRSGQFEAADHSVIAEHKLVHDTLQKGSILILYLIGDIQECHGKSGTFLYLNTLHRFIKLLG